MLGMMRSAFKLFPSSVVSQAGELPPFPAAVADPQTGSDSSDSVQD